MSTFAKVRPEDLVFITKKDLLDDQADVFGETKEWDDLTFHVRACPMCRNMIEAGDSWSHSPD